MIKLKLLKVCVLFLSFAVIIFGIVCFLMWNDTRELISYVSNVFYGNYSKDELNGKKEAVYDVKNYKAENNNATVELKLNTKFVWHNFRRGCIWINYTAMAYTPEGNLVYASKDIPAKWDIEKQNCKWVITKITEAL